MKKTLILFLFTYSFLVSKAQVQKLTLENLEATLNATLNEAEENLFLKGYSFAGRDTLADAGILHNFSTRGKTVKNAKAVSKAVYENALAKTYVQYVTYEYSEFRQFRQLMIETNFERNSTDSISENSSYFKDNLEIKFKVDKFDTNKAYIITLKNRGLIGGKKPGKKLSLKNILKTE